MIESKMTNTIWEYFKMMFVEPSGKILAVLLDGAWYKSIFTFLIYIISHIYEDGIAYNVLIYFILTDTFTGVWAAITRKERLSSRRFRFSVVKLILYSLLISVFHQLEFISPTFASVVRLDSIVLGYLAVTELLSIMENIAIITHIKYPSSITKKLNDYIGLDSAKKPK